MPFECFHEDEYSLGGILTCVGCVLPEEIYDAVDYRKSVPILGSGDVTHANDYFFIKDGAVKNHYREGTPEHDLIMMVKSCSLAR
jgi:hypothetical protein